MKDAVRRISGEDCEIVGASRTDSGAHAQGQVCHFDSQIPAERWVQAINQSVKSDLRAVSAEEAMPDFHARFMALDRTYVYRLLRTPDPFRERYAHFVHWNLDVEAMQKAATLLVGRHDYRAFTEELSPTVENTLRKLFEVRVQSQADEVQVWIRGTAFLRGMMRRMSGGLLEVGRGRRPLESFAKLLTEQRNEESWPVVLPANGLTLMEVRYGHPPRDVRNGPSEHDFDGESRTEQQENEDE